MSRELSERERLVDPTIRIQGVRHTRVKIEDYGTKVDLRDTPHCNANHFIKTSRKYFSGKQLRCYWDFPGMRPLAVVLFLGSFAGPVSFAVVIVCLVVCVFAIGFFAQHESVSQNSLPTVLTQPVFPSQTMLNNFYKVTVSELKGGALTFYQQGIGYLQVTHGVIEFQGFHPKAVALMKKARRFSRIMLFCYCLALGFNMLVYILDLYSH